MNGSNLLTATAAFLLFLALGCAKKQEPIAETPAPSDARRTFDPSSGTASVSGKVTYEGAVPPAAPIKMGADPVCATIHKEPVVAQEILANNGNLQNVLIYVKQGLEKYAFATPNEPAMLDQQGCQYKPHVGAVMVNQKLRIVNSDPTLHNVHCWAEQNPQFNIGQAIQGMETIKSFSRPEVMVKFKCDVHKWMSGYLAVLPHPYYAVTAGDGAFNLKNLPPGDYVIEAWHEKLGTQTQKVTVGDHETKDVSFSFKSS